MYSSQAETDTWEFIAIQYAVDWVIWQETLYCDIMDNIEICNWQTRQTQIQHLYSTSSAEHVTTRCNSLKTQRNLIAFWDGKDPNKGCAPSNHTFSFESSFI